MHFYDHRRFRYSGTEPGSSPAFMGDISQLAADYLPLDYKADFAGLGTIGFVHVEAGVDLADARAETLWLQSLDKAAGRPDAIVAKIDLMADNLREELSWLQRQSMVKAVRQIVS
ncbi:hypothetical protein [Novosphingobium sp. P6W]|uniref:hypothetical protein n=1 Tax=Novosphingobium sp. P6W TaxID=1609758 RepID=UPI0013B381B9|nr:hypothetical protein [Novosphingobium sp. P6W]